MSKKKPLLGPDGKPLDVKKYRPKPEPNVVLDSDSVTLTVGHTPASIGYGFGRSIFGLFGGGSLTIRGESDGKLKAAVEHDLMAFNDAAPADWVAEPELPPPPDELADTYAVAFQQAKKKCEHANSTSTTYARRERQCDDCGAYFTRKEWYER